VIRGKHRCSTCGLLRVCQHSGKSWYCAKCWVEEFGRPWG